MIVRPGRLIRPALPGICRNGLVALYDCVRPGSGSVLTDLSGAGNNAALAAAPNDPQWTAAGLSFDGTRWASFGPLILGARTIVAVVYPTDVTTAHRIICSSSASQYFDRYNSAGFIATAYGGLNKTAVGGALPANQWRFVAGVAAVGSACCWVGATKGTPTAATGIPDNAALTWIGKATSTDTTTRLVGTLAALAIYNRALSDGEVLQTHAASQRLMKARGVALP